MMMAREPCTGTLVEHEVGPVECTDDGCSAAPEEHWLVVRCVELVCRCGQDQTGERSTHPTSST